MKRYLGGFLLICFFLINPFLTFGEEIPSEPSENQPIENVDVQTENGEGVLPDENPIVNPIENPEASVILNDVQTTDEIVQDEITDVAQTDTIQEEVQAENQVPATDQNTSEPEGQTNEEATSNEVQEGNGESQIEDSPELVSEEVPVEDPIEQNEEDDENFPPTEGMIDQLPTEGTIDEFSPEGAISQSRLLTHQLIINEVMVGSEVNPENDAWIEFYNPGNEAIILTGWQIRGITKGGRWIDITNQADHLIQPEDYFLLSRYSNSSYSALAIKPEMTKSSIFFPDPLIEIELKDPNGNLSDRVLIDHITSDQFRSYERNLPIGNGLLEENWETASLQVNLKDNLQNTFATPKSANSLYYQPAQAIGETDLPAASNPDPVIQTRRSSQPQNKVDISYPDYQIINEIMVNPVGKDTEGEWIELYNNTDHPIDLRGWYVDDAEGNSRPYQINLNALLYPNHYLVIKEPALKLSFKNDTDQVRLLAPNKEAKETIFYDQAKENWTYSKKANDDFEWTPLITPNEANQFPPPPKAYRWGEVTFKNVLPNPEGNDAGNEKIILQNHLNEILELDKWKLVNRKGKEFYLSGWRLGANESQKFNPSEIKLTLVNTGDFLDLIDPAGNLIDQINWIDAGSGRIIYAQTYFQEGQSAEVVDVIDGDTIKVLIRGDLFRLRLIGIDTPELFHPFKEIESFAQESADYLKQMIQDQTVRLEFDETKTDIFNRMLAYVYLGDQLINAQLIKQGYAYAYTRYPFKYLEDFIQYEQEAKEKGLGIWQIAEIEEIIKENEEEIEIEEIADEQEEMTTAASKSRKEIKCPTEGLVIESILPNSQKGLSLEYIRLINKNDKTICLKGWSLDDIPQKGTKAFQIKGGSIASGAMRTFRKPETKIALNNKNDCATLINPLGKIVDQICYNKTHKNEIFTHEGGDWQPKRRGRTYAANKTKSPKRDKVAYQWELKNETLHGKIAFIYEEGEIFYITTENQKIIPISYAGSKVNISLAKELLDPTKPISVQIRSTEEGRQLIGIDQEKSQINPPRQKNTQLPELKTILLLMVMIGGLYGLKRRLN